LVVNTCLPGEVQARWCQLRVHVAFGYAGNTFLIAWLVSKL